MSSSPSLLSSNANHTELSLSTTSEFDAIQYDQCRDIYMMGSIKAPFFESDERRSRAPIDIVCVIDRSGSMSGDKINLVKKTLSFMVEQLKELDRISLVSFDSSVTTDLKLTEMTPYGKKKALKAIDHLKAGTCTNLSGGIFEAFEIIRHRYDPNDVVSMLVFTDGLANKGITSTPDIVRNMESMLQEIAKKGSVNAPPPDENDINGDSTMIPKRRETNVTVFTFGFGEDHDANMLRTISDCGNGLYYFLQKEDEIAQAFADCLGGLLSVIAQNIVLNIKCISFPQTTLPDSSSVGQIKLKKICSAYRVQKHNSPDDIISSTIQEITLTKDDNNNNNEEKKKMKESEEEQKLLSDGDVDVFIGDMYSEEQKDIVFLVEVPQIQSPSESPIPTVSLSLEYVDVVAARRVKRQCEITLRRPERINPEEAIPVNKELDKQRNRVSAANVLDTARKLADKGRFVEARELLNREIDRINASLSSSDPFCQGLIKDLRNCLGGLTDSQSYASIGSKMINNYYQSNTRQRSTATTSAAQDSYITSLKQTMRNKFSFIKKK